MWWKKFFLGLTVSATLTSIPGAKAEAAPLSYEEMSLFYDPEGAYGDNLSIPCNTEAYVAVPVIEVMKKIQMDHIISQLVKRLRSQESTGPVMPW